MAKNFYADTMEDKLAKVTPQTMAIPGREADMARNNAGGVTFVLDQWGYLDRFLILGSDKPSYYASAQKLTKDAAKNVIACIKADGVKAVARIVEISDAGRAPKNDPAIFALALCTIHGDAETVKAAFDALPKVARIGTHLFQFVETIDTLGKWNAAAKRGIAAWYNNRNNDRLAVQLLKYKQRNGWSQRDVLRLAHVKAADEVKSAMFYETVKQGERKPDVALPALYDAVEAAKTATPKQMVKLIADNPSLSWEMLPTECLNNPDVWAALLPNLGMTALIRQLGRLTNIGLIKPMSNTVGSIVKTLTDGEKLKAGRIHPITLLIALKNYAAGKGEKGSTTWNPVAQITDALDTAFYEAFNFVEQTDQGFLLGVDCSGSMFGARVQGTPLTSAEVAGVMALALAKREPKHWIGGFNHKMGELKITPKMRLDQAMTVIRNFSWGTTDCALPMLHALEHKMDGIDKFVVITDNETYAGRIQPVQALKQYRAKYNPNAKLIVCGTSVTQFTIADPKDPGMLDIVGFDSAAPQLIQTF